MNTLAIDIGGTKFTVALFADEKMIRRETRSTDREGGREWMLAQIESVVTGWSQESAGKTLFDRCGIGFGGPVDFASQRVALSTHVGGWQDFGLCEHFQRICDVPVVMDNDANVGGLGEAVYGSGSARAAGGPFRPLLYVTLSTGIGGGIVFAGDEVYRGADSYAGEIGHLTVDPDGPECLCGSRGCLERMCSGLWVELDYGKPAYELFKDPAFVERYVIRLAMGLKAAVMLLNPSRIVLGGGISKAGEALFGPLRAELRKQVTNWSRARLDVVPAALGDDSVLWGALALARGADRERTTRSVS